MKALLIHRFFQPDSPPYAIILRDMADIFLKNKFTVDVLSSKPSYKVKDYCKREKYKTTISEKLRIFRIPVSKTKLIIFNKIINYFWFPLAAFIWILFKRKYSVITVSTSPPVILPFVVALSCRLKGCKLIYHCMDVHPEIGEISGEFKNKFIFRLLLWMDNYTCITATKIIVLSQDMKNSILKRDVAAVSEKIEIINNYELPSYAKNNEVKRSLLKSKDVQRVVFTGNIGRYQNLLSFVDALLKYDTINNFELVFVGEGVSLNKLKILAEPLGNTVKFFPHQPVDVTKAIILDADMAIVSLGEGIINYAYPSKTMTYMSQGTPILLSVEDDSELSKFILDNKIGIKVRPSNLDDIYNVFKGLSTGSAFYSNKKIKKAYQDNFSFNVFNSKLEKILNNLKTDNL